MFGLFKKKAVVQENLSGIAFHPNLIHELVAEHRRLLELYNEIKAQFQQRKLRQVEKLLDELGSLLRNHLLKENMNLYLYLGQITAGDQENSKLVRDFHREMEDIVRPAVRFLEKYSDMEYISENDISFFVGELEHIFAVVRERMGREERFLYPLYQQKTQGH